MWNKDTHKEVVPSGIDVTLPELISLRSRVVHSQAASKKKSLNLPGQKLTSFRGRGIEFDGTREYQTGDDIRNMAWRITARSLKPHIKVYKEERERPVWLAVDLSPSLYFGTRSMFKSVCSIKQATQLGWIYLNSHERVGAAIATQQKVDVYKPRADDRHFLTILNGLVNASKQQPVFSEANYLQNLLRTLQQVRSGSLVFIISDFFQFDNEVQKLIAHIAQRTQVILNFVYDPFEAEPPRPYRYLVTDGIKKALFNMESSGCRQSYQRQFQHKLDTLQGFARKHNISLQTLRTNEELK